MNDKSSGRQTLEIMVLSTVIGFVAWLVLLFVVWRILQSAGIMANFWAMVEALSTAVTAAALIGGGFVAYRQLVEGASTRYIDVADRLFGELNSEENIEARRWIYQNLDIEKKQLQEMEQKIMAGQDFDIGEEKLKEMTLKITTEGQEPVKRTLNSLDRVAFLTQPGWIPDDIIMPWMNPMIVKSWMRLKPYVENQRKVRKEPDYYVDAGKLGDRCVRWRIEKYKKAVSEPSPDAI